MSFFSHLGKSSECYLYQLEIHEVAPLACQDPLQLWITRGKKTYQTQIAMSDGHQCKFEEHLSLVSTIYFKKGKNGKKEFDKKLHTLTIQTDQGNRNKLLSSSKHPIVQLTAEIDFASFVSDEMLNKEITRSFPLKDATGKSIAMLDGAAPVIKITFKVSTMKKGPDGDSAEPSSRRSRQNSISLSSAAAPPNGTDPTKNVLASFSRPVDELSPEPKPTKPQRPMILTASSAASSSIASSPLPSDISARKFSRGVSKRNMYGDLEIEPASADVRKWSDNSPKSTNDHKSYAIGEEHEEGLHTPPRQHSPKISQTPAKPVVAATPTTVAASPAATELDDSKRKRRSETQLFHSIMTNEISRSAPGALNVTVPDSSPRPLSRQPSFKQPVPSPQVISRRASAVQSQTEVPSSHVGSITASDGEFVPMIRTDSTASLDEAGIQSYSHLTMDDDLQPSPSNAAVVLAKPSATNLDVDDDDDHSLGHGSSFTDRHLTVDDILAPGFGGDASHVSAGVNEPESSGHKKKHGRNISMFRAGETEGAAAVEQILRPASGQSQRGSTIGKFFSAVSGKGDGLMRKISTTRGSVSGAPSNSQDSQPSSAATPRTPNVNWTTPQSTMVMTSHTTHSHPLSHSLPAPIVMNHSSSLAREQSLSRTSAQTLDDMLDGTNHILGIINTTNSTLGSREHSRHTSRSNSPSRQSSSTTTTSTPAQTGSYGPTLSLTSPRTGGPSKPTFPHTSPAKHSLAHAAHMSGSYNKEDFMRQLSGGSGTGGAGLPPTGSPQLDANGAEIGSYAAWKASLKQRRANKSSGGGSSGGGSGDGHGLPLTPGPADNESIRSLGKSGSKTLPRLTITPKPSQSLNRETAASLRDMAASLTQTHASSSGGGHRNSFSVSVTAPEMTAPTPTTTTSSLTSTKSTTSSTTSASDSAGLTEMTAAEQQFHDRIEPLVQLVCEQLHIPGLIAEWDESSISTNLPLPIQPSPNSLTPKKGLWNSLKSGFSSGSSNSSSANPSTAPSPMKTTPTNTLTPAALAAAASLPSSPPPEALREAFYNESIPSWPCILLRCLAEWDAFAVSSIVTESNEITRVPARTWILSRILTHLHQTCLYLCSRSTAGQQQNALCFFITTLTTLIQLVDGYSQTNSAPPPYPVLYSPTPAAQAAANLPTNYEQSIQTPNFPIQYASSRHINIVTHLPTDSRERICEIARTNLRLNKNLRSSTVGSSPPIHFPYSISLGVSPYLWFLGHLRQFLHDSYQCLLEVVLTEVEMVDPTSILSSTAESSEPDSVGFENSMEQLLKTYEKIWDDLKRQHVIPQLRQHMIKCLFVNLNSSLFNSILSSTRFMNIHTGMRLKIIYTSILDWSHNQGSKGLDQVTTEADTAVLNAEAQELDRLCTHELGPCQQLAMLLLMDKKHLTLEDLSSLCPSMTPLSLYHLLLNYAPKSNSNGSQTSSQTQSHGPDEVVNESVLDELTEYQTYFLSKTTGPQNPFAQPKFKILFPAWNAHTKTDPKKAHHEDETKEAEDDDDYLSLPPPKVSPTAGHIQSPFIDTEQPLLLPNLSISSTIRTPSLSSSPSTLTIQLRLSDVPLPQPLKETKPLRFLQTLPELALPITKG